MWRKPHKYRCEAPRFNRAGCLPCRAPSARYTHTDALARRQERNLDAVTVATLLELKLNPAGYKALLRRIHERTPLDAGDDERAAVETAFAARLDALNRLEVALRKPNKGRGRGNAG